MKKLKILIVEDESLTALHIKKILEEDGYEVSHMVSTAGDALKILEEKAIDMVMIDIKINGECDGVCFAEEVNSKYDIPLIFLTAQIDDETLQRISQTTYSAYISKPFTSNELLSTVKLVAMQHKLHENTSIVELGEGYSYEYIMQRLVRHNQPIILTPKEQLLFHLLISKQGICSFIEIDENLWMGEYVDDGTRRSLIHRLKKKIPGLEILTHRGIGIELKR